MAEVDFAAARLWPGQAKFLELFDACDATFVAVRGEAGAGKSHVCRYLEHVHDDVIVADGGSGATVVEAFHQANDPGTPPLVTYQLRMGQKRAVVPMQLGGEVGLDYASTSFVLTRDDCVPDPKTRLVHATHT